MISIVEGSSRRRLVLEGKLIAPWASELKTAYEKARADLQGRELVVDMKNVITISREGENVLLELINEGVKFRCRGLFSKHVLKQLVQPRRRNLQEVSK